MCSIGDEHSGGVGTKPTGQILNCKEAAIWLRPISYTTYYDTLTTFGTKVRRERRRNQLRHAGIFQEALTVLDPCRGDTTNIFRLILRYEFMEQTYCSLAISNVNMSLKRFECI